MTSVGRPLKNSIPVRGMSRRVFKRIEYLVRAGFQGTTNVLYLGCIAAEEPSFDGEKKRYSRRQTRH